jgi:hypothetical protein
MDTLAMLATLPKGTGRIRLMYQKTAKAAKTEIRDPASLRLGRGQCKVSARRTSVPSVAYTGSPTARAATYAIPTILSGRGDSSAISDATSRQREIESGRAWSTLQIRRAKGRLSLIVTKITWDYFQKSGTGVEGPAPLQWTSCQIPGGVSSGEGGEAGRVRRRC